MRRLQCQASCTSLHHGEDCPAASEYWARWVYSLDSETPEVDEGFLCQDHFVELYVKQHTTDFFRVVTWMSRPPTGWMIMEFDGLVIDVTATVIDAGHIMFHEAGVFVARRPSNGSVHKFPSEYIRMYANEETKMDSPDYPYRFLPAGTVYSPGTIQEN